MTNNPDQDFKVADLSLAPCGRKEIELAEHEMPGLMALRAEYTDSQPLKGARITGSLHMTIQTAVLIETLTALGAEVRWVSCNIFSTQDHAAAAVAVGPEGTVAEPRACPCSPGRARRSRSTGGAPSRPCAGPTAAGPNMILDDGGDATLLVHKGVEYEKAGVVPDATDDDPDEWKVVLDLLKRSLAEDPNRWTDDRRRHQGRHRGDHHRRPPALPDVRGRPAAVPGHQRQRLGHQVEVRQPLRLPPQPHRRHQPRHRRDARRQGRRRLRLRRGRQGLRPVAPGPGLPASSSPRSTRSARCRPRWRASRSPRSRTCSTPPTSSSPPPATRASSRPSTWRRMKHNAIVGNIGHFDNEIDMAGLARMSDVRKIEIKPQVDEFVFPDGHSIIVLSEGRLLNLGNATGHPSFVMSMSFTNQVLAQIELFTTHRAVPARRVRAAEGARREGRPAPPRRPRREAHRARPGAGRLHRRPGRRPLQARELPLLGSRRRTAGWTDMMPPTRSRLRRRRPRSGGVAAAPARGVMQRGAEPP